MNYKVVKKQKYADDRGYLAEFLTRDELEKNSSFGHIYFVTFERPGIIRGNHYHHTKDEYFGIAYGRVRLVIQDIKTKIIKQFILNTNDKEFVRVQIGPNIAHAVESLSEKAVLIDYFPKPYDHTHPDNQTVILISQTLTELD